MSARLLAMAFAASDLLFELDGDRIAFALGAGPVGGQDPAVDWPGRALADVLAPTCRARVQAMLGELRPGRRSEPVEVLVLAGDGRGRKGCLRAFRMPDLDPAVSCAVQWVGEVQAVAPPRAQPLLDARGLLRRLGELLAVGGTGPELSIDFVEVPGLAGLDEPHRRAGQRIEARLQSISLGADSAARLAPDRFALMRRTADVASLADEVRAAAAAEGLDLSAVASRADVGSADAALAMRTLRLALDDCLRDGAAAGGQRFGEHLKRTVKDVESFRNLVRERRFSLVWQPIVALDTRVCCHFEALARFGSGTAAPTASIGMAEELGLIEGFDLAVAEKAIAQLRRPGFGLTRAALNVSGASLAGDGYVDGLLQMTADFPDVRKRLMVEITETAAVADLDSAERRLRALRAAGIGICLDDYGVGAASLAYLRKLPVDLLKLDGAFVRDIGRDPKVRTVAAHLVELCQELGISTVAEMIETESEAAAMRRLGVGFGQGWLFGRPADTPTAPAVSPAAARRKGEMVGWG